MVKSRWKPLLAGFALAVGLGIFVLSIVGAPTTVRAQDDAGTTAGERSSAFRAVEGPDAEQVPGGTLLISAYGVMWLFLFLYVFRVQRMQAATQSEVARLTRVLESAASEDPEG